MSFHELARRLSFLLRRKRRLDDLESEMRLHRELRAARMESQGLGHADAAYASERRFGNKTLIKEISGNMWSWAWVDDLSNDLRHTCRILAANPLFTMVVVLTLALGIGANTAIFSVINVVLLRALPVHDPQQLFYVHVEPGQPAGAFNTGNGNSSFSEYVFEQLRTERDTFASLMAYVPADAGKVAVRAGIAPEEATVFMVSGDFLSGLGAATVCGRTLTLADEHQHAPAAVLSYGFWNSHFEKNCSALGRTLYIKGVAFTVVGVAARDFSGIENNAVDVWIPLQKRPELNAWGNQQASYYEDPNWWCLKLIARLAPGVTDRQAGARLEPVFRRAAYQHLGGSPRKGETPRKLVLVAATGIGDSGGELEKPLYVLLGMVGLILVIACGNVAMLMAARNAARQREFSLRMAIGGSRPRLFRQLLAESLVLVGAGALLGWVFAIVATTALAAWSQMEISLAPDRHVLLFTLGIAVTATLCFCVAPLLTVVRIPLGLALKTSSSTAFQEKSKSRGARAMVALQVALCLILTVAAGLLVRTLRNLEREGLGMRTSGLLVFGLNPQLASHSDTEAIRFFGNLLVKLRALPGVESVTLMGNRIGAGWSNNTSAIVDGRDPRADESTRSNSMRWNNVGPNYFTTLGIPVLLGRDFTDADSATAPRVAIVNQTFAQRFLKGLDPLGHEVAYTKRLPFTIIGVVGKSKYTGVRERDVPMAYFPYTQVGFIGSLHIEVRTAGEPSAFWPQVRTAVAQYAPELPLLKPTTQQAQFDDSISQERLVARLSLCFGALATLLVATGLYGTLAYGVKRRTAELGVRLAIGAQRHDLLWMILRESLVISAVGIIVGLPLTIGLMRTVASVLYGLASNDPLNLALCTIGILLVNLVASLVPAMHAASMDPVAALRHE